MSVKQAFMENRNGFVPEGKGSRQIEDLGNKEVQKSNVVDSMIGKRPRKKSSALLAASVARSAVDHVMAHSARDVRGTNGLANTGPVTSYENED